MKRNWLWDSRLSVEEAENILKDRSDPRFDYFAEKLISRDSPKVVFDLMSEESFCRRWPQIKKRMRKNQWAKQRVDFWDVIYKRVYERLKEKGIMIRRPERVDVSRERMEVSSQIRKIRKSTGLTQKDVADRLGVIQQYISKIETGHENISIDSLKRIADVLDKKLIVRLR